MDELRQRIQSALAGTYEIERELGGGGMSRTYLARERAFDRRVVVKVLAPELLQGLSVERFRREVLLAAQLQHPHVVPVLAAGDVDGLPWFTMPYVDGDSLRQRLALGPLSITEAVGILRDVARALAYAHSHGVIHRDIKPDNVLLSAGSATVTDFGIAKAISAARAGPESAAPALTMTGMSIGTPTYMSPEQAAGDPNIDTRADLYAFGAMAYEVLAGRPPFHGLTPTKLLTAHLQERPRDVRTLRSDCPDALAALVMQCLEKEPSDRPASAADLARVLDTITSSGAAAAAPSILAGGRIALPKALALWAVATVAVVITVWAAREAIGLPDWTLVGAGGVMLAGLPMILATWYAQRTVHRTYVGSTGGTGASAPVGTMATLALKASPHLSWKRTWLGGSIAVSGFGVLIVAFMVMRAMGIGPFGSLQGRGEFGARETIVVADFESPADDPTLGATVAEALRTDLVQSQALEVLTRAETRDAMVRMRRGADEAVPFALARELATREGAKAVLDGAIVRLGRSYVITARLVSALDGTELVPFRETAANEDELLPALGRIARAVRERAGESLRSIRASDELSRVTTASLPALRKYVEGVRVADEEGDTQRGLALLEEAVALDTAFAMAWRKMAALLNNAGVDPTRAKAALETAYRHRDRLTESERLLTEGYYFTNGPTVNYRRAVEAYEAAARIPGMGTGGLNNAAVVYGYLREHERSEQLYRQVVAGGTRFATSWTNLMITQFQNGRIAALDSARDGYRAAFPAHDRLWFADFLVARANERWDEADSVLRTGFGPALGPFNRAQRAGTIANVAELRGRPTEALRWRAQSAAATLEVSSAPSLRLGASLDSTITYLFTLDRPAEARVMLTRALERYPLAAMPEAERPWFRVIALAALTGNTALTRSTTVAVTPAMLNAFGPDSAGVRAFLNGLSRIAEEDWSAALPGLQQGDRTLAVDEQFAALFLARAHDGAGNADSAIAQYQRYASHREAGLALHARTLGSTHRRLGELYEARGDRTRAIENYQRTVDLWSQGEPDFVRQADELRARIRRLSPPG
jgi:tetratricopeptide (TPR) repeat protein